MFQVQSTSMLISRQYTSCQHMMLKRGKLALWKYNHNDYLLRAYIQLPCASYPPPPPPPKNKNKKKFYFLKRDTDKKKWKTLYWQTSYVNNTTTPYKLIHMKRNRLSELVYLCVYIQKNAMKNIKTMWRETDRQRTQIRKLQYSRIVVLGPFGPI